MLQLGFQTELITNTLFFNWLVSNPGESAIREIRELVEIRRGEYENWIGPEAGKKVNGLADSVALAFGNWGQRGPAPECWAGQERRTPALTRQVFLASGTKCFLSGSHAVSTWPQPRTFRTVIFGKWEPKAGCAKTPASLGHGYVPLETCRPFRDRNLPNATQNT
jgi:hypothetical protein